MIRIKKAFPNINKNKNINQLYDAFLKYDLKYVIVHNGNLLFEGVIYKNDLFGQYEASRVGDLKELYKKYDALVNNGNADSIKEKARECFRKDKNLLVLPVVNKEGKVEYCIEKDILDRNLEENKFYYKYSILLQYGYSIGKWLRDRNVISVNLIGGSQLIVPLYNDLIKNEISINYIIDHQFFEMGGGKK